MLIRVGQDIRPAQMTHVMIKLTRKKASEKSDYISCPLPANLKWIEDRGRAVKRSARSVGCLGVLNLDQRWLLRSVL